MRVTGGDLGGRTLASPKRGDVRPTTDMVREAVFSILGDVSGARVLDPFAGTGALAIEALSRGAAAATLVDLRTETARRNIEELGLDDRAEVVGADTFRWLDRAPEAAFDLVLCDPPYALSDPKSSRLAALLPRALAPGGRLVIESFAGGPIELDLPVVREREYGDTLIRIHQGREDGGEA
jgi:16S rRNA (guanine966-N2)-methyltransferase